MKARTRKKIEHYDYLFISFFREYADEVARAALFLIFFWFGILKVFLVSPAGPLVIELLNATFLRGVDPNGFLVWFGVFEMLIAVMILIPKLERITFAVMGIHLFTTVMPLYLVTSVTWDGWFVPTLIGQYIIKNAAIISIGLLLVARIRPMKQTHSFWAHMIE